MRFIPAGTDKLPRRCALLPGRSELSEKEGWVDTGVVLTGWDNQISVSKAGVREAARAAGLPTEDDLEKAQAEIAELRTENKELGVLFEKVEEENQRLGGLWDAVDVIEAQGGRAKRKAGRPVQKKPIEKVTY